MAAFEASRSPILNRKITRKDYNEPIELSGTPHSLPLAANDGSIIAMPQVTPENFGAVGDGETDDSEAFIAALAYLKEQAVTHNSLYKAGLKLRLGNKKYYLGSTTLDITFTVQIVGEGAGFTGVGGATQLRWADATTGIRIQAHNTSGVNTVDADFHTTGAGTIISGVELVGGYVASEGESHGLHAKARFTLRDCVVRNFPGDGVYLWATSLDDPPHEGNANLFRAQNCAFSSNRNGFYTNGADANAGSVINCDASYNRAWGFNENSFLGNTYVGCHTSLNVSGPYRSTNANGQNVFVSCYSEGDQPASSFVSPTVVIGGLHAAGVTGTAGYLRANGGRLLLGNASATSVLSPEYAIDNAMAYPLGASWRVNNANHFSLSYAGSDQPQFQAMQFTTPGSSYGMDAHYPWFHRGFYAGAAGSAWKMFTGSQPAAVADASGGGTIDTEARFAINALLARLRSAGVIAS